MARHIHDANNLVALPYKEHSSRGVDASSPRLATDGVIDGPMLPSAALFNRICSPAALLSIER